MPEGHTIHRLAKEHTAILQGRPLRLASPQGRFAEGAALLDGRVLEKVRPHGKHLFYGFEGRAFVHVHLGLYGTFVAGPRAAMPEPKGALRLRILTDQSYVDLRGPTACEVLTPAEMRSILDRLGPDPLRRDGDPQVVWSRVSRSRTAVGALLMDQSVIAGIGNVYRAELLFRHGISPHRPGLALGESEWAAMWADLQVLMRAGVKTGYILTTRPEHRPRRRGVPPREDRFYVYRRTGEACRICGTPVRTEAMAGRNLYWCPGCQPV